MQSIIQDAVSEHMQGMDVTGQGPHRVVNGLGSFANYPEPLTVMWGLATPRQSLLVFPVTATKVTGMVV